MIDELSGAFNWCSDHAEGITGVAKALAVLVGAGVLFAVLYGMGIL